MEFEETEDLNEPLSKYEFRHVRFSSLPPSETQKVPRSSTVASLLRKLHDSSPRCVSPEQVIETVKDNTVKDAIDRMEKLVTKSLENIASRVGDMTKSLNESKQENVLLSVLQSVLDGQAKIEKRLDEIQSNAPAESNPMVIDKPTKMMILNMNDKLIQLSKINQHVGDAQSRKMSQIEEKIEKLIQASQNRDVEQVLVKLNEIGSKTIKRADSDSSIDSVYDSEAIKRLEMQVEEIGRMISKQTDVSNKEQQVNQDRLKQFLGMLSILQDAHSRLATQLEQRLDSDKHSNMIESIHNTLISYLPLNLETKLNEIHQELRRPGATNVPAGDFKASMLSTWQQDIMSRHATLAKQLDSIQHSLLNLGSASKEKNNQQQLDVLLELKSLVQPCKQIRILTDQIESLKRQMNR